MKALVTKILFTFLTIAYLNAFAQADVANSAECEDRNSLANLRGECQYTPNAAPVETLVVDIRALSPEEATIKIHEAVRQAARHTSYAEQSNEKLAVDKNLRILHDGSADVNGTVLVAAGLRQLVDRPDLKKHIVAGALAAEAGTYAYNKLRELNFIRGQSNQVIISKIVGLATACFVGVAKEVYDSRFPESHTVDKKDAIATCAGGAGILLKTEIKF